MNRRHFILLPFASVFTSKMLHSPVNASGSGTATPVPQALTIPFTNPSAVTTDGQGMTPEASPASDHVAHGGRLGWPELPILRIWSDFQCPHCQHFHDDYEGRMIEDFVVRERLQIEYNDFPVIGIRSDEFMRNPAAESVNAAEAIVAAAEQGGYLALREALFAVHAHGNTGMLTPTEIANTAAESGLDGAAILKAIDQNRYEQFVIDMKQLARNQYQVSSTPAFALDDIRLPWTGDYAAFAKLINDLLS